MCASSIKFQILPGFHAAQVNGNIFLMYFPIGIDKTPPRFTLGWADLLCLPRCGVRPSWEFLPHYVGFWIKKKMLKETCLDLVQLPSPILKISMWNNGWMLFFVLHRLQFWASKWWASSNIQIELGLFISLASLSYLKYIYHNFFGQQIWLQHIYAVSPNGGALDPVKLAKASILVPGSSTILFIINWGARFMLPTLGVIRVGVGAVKSMSVASESRNKSCSTVATALWGFSVVQLGKSGELEDIGWRQVKKEEWMWCGWCFSVTHSWDCFHNPLYLQENAFQKSSMERWNSRCLNIMYALPIEWMRTLAVIS